jgi:hypothetical protein
VGIAGRGFLARQLYAVGTKGDGLRTIKEALLTCFEVVAYGALLSLLPCVVAELIFGCAVTDILVQVVLVGVAGTGILTTIAVHEGCMSNTSQDWVSQAIGSSRAYAPSLRRPEARTAATSGQASRAHRHC